MQGPPLDTQARAQTHSSSLWSDTFEPVKRFEKQQMNKTKKTVKPRPKKHAPTSQKELTRLDSSDLASSCKCCVLCMCSMSVTIMMVTHTCAKTCCLQRLSVHGDEGRPVLINAQRAMTVRGG